MNKYSIKKGLLKAVISIVLFAIPVFINQFSEIANLSIGGALVLIANYLKVRYN